MFKTEVKANIKYINFYTINIQEIVILITSPETKQGWVCVVKKKLGCQLSNHDWKY